MSYYLICLWCFVGDDSENKTKFGAVATIAVALFTLIGTVTTTLYADRQKLEERIYTLEREVGNLQEKRQAADLLALELKYKLAEEVDKNKVVMEFMDAIPLPMWAKRQRDDGEFEMVMLNEEFEKIYGITKERYIGSTDKDLWPDDIYKVFKEGDNKVLNSKKYLCRKETVVIGGKKVPAHVCKFPFTVDRRKFLVGGITFY